MVENKTVDVKDYNPVDPKTPEKEEKDEFKATDHIDIKYTD